MLLTFVNSKPSNNNIEYKEAIYIYDKLIKIKDEILVYKNLSK